MSGVKCNCRLGAVRQSQSLDYVYRVQIRRAEQSYLAFANGDYHVIFRCLHGVGSRNVKGIQFIETLNRVVAVA